MTLTRTPRTAWRAAVVTAATVCAVASTSSPARPAAGSHTTASARQATVRAPYATVAPGERPVSELLAELRGLHRATETASRAYRRTARALREQRELTHKLERRLSRVHARLAVERAEVGRIARARYRYGGPEFSPTVRVLLADDPVRALHHGHTLRRAAERRQATVRALASDERHRGAVAEQAREALARQRKLAERKKRQRKTARAALAEVQRLLVSLPPDRLAALREAERRQAGEGEALSGSVTRPPTSGPEVFGDRTGTRP